MRKASLLAILIAVTLLLTLAYPTSLVEAKGITATDLGAYSQESSAAAEPATIKMANLSCQELSALGSAVKKVLDEERKLGEIRTVALVRAQELAGEAEDVGGLFSGPIGFFKKFLSSLGWIEVQPPENVVTLSIESETTILAIGEVAGQWLQSLGPAGQLGAAIVKVLSPGAKWLGKEWAEWLTLRDVGYFTVAKPGVGTMDVVYDKGAKEACINVHLEDLEGEWKERYNWENEHIYMYLPFDKEPSKLKKTDGRFDYKVVFKYEALTKFEVGAIVKVTNTDDSGLSIHKDDPIGEAIKVVPDEWVFSIISGSRYNAQGHNWWQILAEKHDCPVEGWVAEDFLTETSYENLVPSSPPDYVSSAHDKVEQAIEWAKSKEGSLEWEDLCLRFVSQAYGLGENVNLETTEWTCPNDAIEKLGNKFYPATQSWNPPRGALIFFSATGEYERYGHIGIYLGEGELIHAYGTVRIQNLAGNGGVEQLPYIGSYIGWAYPPEEWIFVPKPTGCKTFSEHPGDSARVSLSARVSNHTISQGETINIQAEMEFVGPETPILGTPVVIIWNREWHMVRHWFINAGGQLVLTRPELYCIFKGDKFSFNISWDLTDNQGGFVPAGEYRIQVTIESPHDTGSFWLLSRVSWGDVIINICPPPLSSVGKIAFVSDRDGNMEIYVMDTSGENQINLTRNPANDWDPAWSPDGSKIAFISNRDGNLEIYIMDVDGNNMTRLTSNEVDDLNPAWFPDGTKLVFGRNVNNGKGYILDPRGNWEHRIFVMNADGSNQRQLEIDPEIVKADYPLREYNNNEPAVSPDGSRIAFTVESWWSGHPPVIYMMNSDGTNVTRFLGKYVFETPSWGENSHGSTASWSPDGRQMILSCQRQEVTPWAWLEGIYVISSDGSGLESILPSGCGFPSWSPDGNWIAFTKGEVSHMKGWENLQIYVACPDGSKVKRITENNANDWDPVWAPR